MAGLMEREGRSSDRVAAPAFPQAPAALLGYVPMFPTEGQAQAHSLRQVWLPLHEGDGRASCTSCRLATLGTCVMTLAVLSAGVAWRSSVGVEQAGSSSPRLSTGLAEELHYALISEGSCAGHGYMPINDVMYCEAAALALGLPDSSAVSTDFAGLPEGCYYFQDPREGAEGLWLGTSPSNRGNGAQVSADGKARQPICLVPAPAHDDKGQLSGASVTQALLGGPAADPPSSHGEEGDMGAYPLAPPVKASEKARPPRDGGDDSAGAPPAFRVGDEVRVRDADDEEWEVGEVTSVDPLLVRPNGWAKGFPWKVVTLLHAPQKPPKKVVAPLPPPAETPRRPAAHAFRRGPKASEHDPTSEPDAPTGHHPPPSPKPAHHEPPPRRHTGGASEHGEHREHHPAAERRPLVAPPPPPPAHGPKEHPAPHQPPPLKQLIKGISYSPVPAKTNKRLDDDDFMSDDTSVLWSQAGRADLALIKSMGANTIRLYGNDPSLNHRNFLDEASAQGLGVILGFSDYPFIQMKGSCASTDCDCYEQIKAQYADNLRNGFLNVTAPNTTAVADTTTTPAADAWGATTAGADAWGATTAAWGAAPAPYIDQPLGQQGYRRLQEYGEGGASVQYHSAIKTVILMNEPDLKFFPLFDPKHFAKAIISAFDAVLDAEKEAGLDPSADNMPNFTTTFSFAVCGGSCRRFGDQPAVGQMWELRRAMQNPASVGYKARNDLWAVYRKRFINSFNTANPARDLKPLFLDTYDAHFQGTPVFVGEYHCPNEAIDQEQDLKQVLSIARDESTLLLGLSFFEFQVRYDKGGSELMFGMFGLGDEIISTLRIAESTFNVRCLQPMPPPVTRKMPPRRDCAEVQPGVAFQADPVWNATLTGVETAGECCTKCRDLPRCQGWTWQPARATATTNGAAPDSVEGADLEAEPTIPAMCTLRESRPTDLDRIQTWDTADMVSGLPPPRNMEWRELPLKHPASQEPRGLLPSAVAAAFGGEGLNYTALCPPASLELIMYE